MIKTTFYRFLIMLVAWLAGVHQAAATVILSDNFAGNALDGAVWTVNTSLSDMYGAPQVVVANNSVEITARGYINTVTNYAPTNPGGLFITGTWTFVDSGSGDLPTVVTRSSGITTSYGVASGEVSAGIIFRISVPPAAPGITIQSQGGLTLTGINVISNTLNLAQGDTVNFSVTDDGTNLSFSVASVGNPASAASATATCTNQLAANKISFYNREFEDCTAALGNLVVQTIPIPGPSLNMALLGNQSVLFWPAWATNYVLQSTTNLASTNWVTAADAVPVIAVTVTNTTPARFFRLSQP